MQQNGDPIDFESLSEQAASAANAQDFERAVELYNQAILRDPERSETYYKRGNALRRLGQVESAIASYNQAIERKSDHAYAYCNRGAAHQALGQNADALESYDKAIAINPGDPLSHYNRALLMQALNEWEEALLSYDRAINIDPTFSDAQYNRAVAQLACGNYENGWSNFEWRWKNASRLGIGEMRCFTQPLWLGADAVAGKRMLLHSEGGLGDTLQFCRYAPLLSLRGATVYLEVQSPLAGILDGLDGVSKVIVRGEPLPHFDYHCPLMSLPLAFKTTAESVPLAGGYLRANPLRVARWRSVSGNTSRLRVGLAWSGNAGNPIDASRSIHLADFIRGLPTEPEYYCLQKDVRASDQVVLDGNPSILKFHASELDFDGTAALCETMDVVVSVDTSVAHLSAAIGRPTWILLPFVPDWRWMQHRADTPWYSSVKLYRQSVAGDWTDVFRRVCADLKSLGRC